MIRRNALLVAACACALPAFAAEPLIDGPIFAPVALAAPASSADAASRPVPRPAAAESEKPSAKAPKAKASGKSAKASKSGKTAKALTPEQAKKVAAIEAFLTWGEWEARLPLQWEQIQTGSLVGLWPAKRLSEPLLQAAAALGVYAQIAKECGHPSAGRAEFQRRQLADAYPEFQTDHGVAALRVLRQSSAGLAGAGEVLCPDGDLSVFDAVAPKADAFAASVAAQVELIRANLPMIDGTLARSGSSSKEPKVGLFDGFKAMLDLAETSPDPAARARMGFAGIFTARAMAFSCKEFAKREDLLEIVALSEASEAAFESGPLADSLPAVLRSADAAWIRMASKLSPGVCSIPAFPAEVSDSVSGPLRRFWALVADANPRAAEILERTRSSLAQALAQRQADSDAQAPSAAEDLSKSEAAAP